MTVIDEYIKDIDPEKKAALNRIRSIAKKIVPSSEDAISYSMPTLKYKGKSFLGFNIHKNHLGIYPYSGEVVAVFKKEFEKLNYGFSSGAIRVPYNNPIPEELLKKIILYRNKMIDNNLK